MGRGSSGQPELGDPIDYSGELSESVKQGVTAVNLKLLSGYSGCRVRAELEGNTWAIIETSCVAVGASYSNR